MKSSLLILLSSLIVTFSFLESHENNEIVNKPVRLKKSTVTDYQTLSELENNYVKDYILIVLLLFFDKKLI